MSATVVEELAAVLGLQVHEGQWERGDSLVRGLTKAVVSLGSAMSAALAVHKLWDWATGVADIGAEAERTAERLGITAEAVQELGFAAKRSGLDQEELVQGLQVMAHQLAEAQVHGTGPFVDGLKLLGVSIDEIKGKNLDQTIAILADAFHRMPDGLAKTAAAMDVGGRSGARMIPLFDRGAAGLAALRAEAKKYGELTNQQAKDAVAFDDQLVGLSAAWQGMKEKAIGPLLPMITQLTARFTAWMSSPANQQLLSGAVRVAIEAVAQGVEIVGGALAFLDRHKEGIGEVITVLKDIGKAIFLLLAPLYAVIHYWPQISAAAKRAWHAIVEATEEAIGWVRDEVEGGVRKIEGAAAAIAHPFVVAFDAVKHAIEKAIAWIKQKIDWVIAEAKKAKDKVEKYTGISALKSVGSGLGHGAGWLADKVTGRTHLDAIDKIVVAPSVPRHQPTLPASAGTTVHNSFSVAVTAPGSDPNHIARVVVEHAQHMLNQAYEAHRGGHE